MNEAPTRTKLIDPVLREKGWEGAPYRWEPEWRVFPGRIDSNGEHGKPGFADYVLFRDSVMVAVVEAKADKYAFDKGEAQSRFYAQALGVRFAYATNGQRVLETDMKTGATRTFEISAFPSTAELDALYGVDDRSELEKACAAVPFSKAGGKTPYYYQERAVEAVIKKIGAGEKRALLTLATGTGKTLIAYQLCHKLVSAKWRNGRPLGKSEPTILFVTDRNVLADQAKGDFFFSEKACFRYVSGTQNPPLDRLVYFTLFQTLLGEDGEQEKYRKFKPDFFDLVIIDECHRGGRNDESEWRKILDYFKDAVHVGLTATPQCDVNGSTYAYFGQPAYVYSLKRGIEEGYLTQYRVAKLVSTLTDYQVTDGDIINYPDEVNPDKPYENDQIERKRMIIDERDRHFVEELFKRMPHDQKAIIFCVTQAHARRIARMIRGFAFEHDYTSDSNYCEEVTADSGEGGEHFLKQFQNNENEIPTILTTSQKLSTGVNAKNIRSIVLFRNVNSMVEFKQIVGRGTRVYPGKGFFYIYDFTNATDNFVDPAWDGEVVCPNCGRNPCVCTKPVPGGSPGSGSRPDSEPAPVKKDIVIRLSPSRTIAARWEEYVFIGDQRVSLQDFIDRFRTAIAELSKDKEDLHRRWARLETREEILGELSEAGFTRDRIKQLQAIIEREKFDVLDVALDLVYDVEPLTRAWRAEHLKRELERMSPVRRKFAEAVLSDYVQNGVWSLGRATLFNYIKHTYGSIEEALKLFDCPQPEKVLELYDDLQERIYQVL